MKQAIIVFTKNIVPGTVKTRLASSIGNLKAADIYEKLVDHTATVVSQTDADVFIYYSSEIELHDRFSSFTVQRFAQYGEDLGERMINAFNEVFSLGNYDAVVLIGSDCPTISEIHVDEAFNHLQENDTVVGPAQDGGYYLVGMRKPQTEIFKGIAWSTDTVLDETLSRIQKLGLTHGQTAILSDLDTIEDLKRIQKEKPGEWSAVFSGPSSA